MNSYYVLVIASGCRRVDEAYRLIKRLSEPDMDAITAESGGTATRRDTWQRDDIRSLAPYYSQLETAHEVARAIPRDPRWPLMAEILNDMMTGVVDGTGAPEELLSVAHLRLSQLLESRR